MTNRDNRGARSLPSSVFPAGLLTVVMFALVSWPVQEFAQQPGAAAGGTFQPPINFAALLASSSKHPLMLATSVPRFGFWGPASNGSLAPTAAGGDDGGIVSGKPSFAPFDAHTLIVSPSGAGAGSEGTAGKKPIGKGGLVLGIVGITVAAAGVLALTVSNHNAPGCAGSISGSTSYRACSDVYTAGEVMVPTGAVVAVTGFYLAFRHRQ